MINVRCESIRVGHLTLREEQRATDNVVSLQTQLHCRMLSSVPCLCLVFDTGIFKRAYRKLLTDGSGVVEPSSTRRQQASAVLRRSCPRTLPTTWLLPHGWPMEQHGTGVSALCISASTVSLLYGRVSCG